VRRTHSTISSVLSIGTRSVKDAYASTRLVKVG
jgi:hypothetical protein